VIDTNRGDRKSGSITFEFRENDSSGTILYTKTSSYANVTNSKLTFDIPSVDLPYPVSKICVVMIQRIMDVDNTPNQPLNSFTFANNQGGWDTWQIVNTDQIAAVTLDTVEGARDAANTAAANATNAYNAANTAATNASNAKTSADTAATRAQTTANQTWYGGKYGGTSESTADIAGYIRNQQLPNLETKINNLQTSITNIQTPTITKVQGQNSATCTTGSTFTVVISATPSSGASYRVTCGSFDSGWVSNNTITITSDIVSGANTATVQVKNTASSTAQTTFTFFKV